MQQHKIEVESMPPPHPVRVTILNQGTIEIVGGSGAFAPAIASRREGKETRTPAYHRRQRSEDRESILHVVPNSSQTRIQEVLTNVIGAHRISPQDSLTDCRFDTDLLSTSNLDLIRIQWQGAFKLEQEVIEDRYIIYIVLAGSLDQKIDLDHSLCCSLDTATIISPGQRLESIASDTGVALLISINWRSIESAASKLFERSLKQPVVFIPRTNPTVICTDFHMDVMDGLELTKQVMANYPRPVLVLSNSVKSDDTKNVFALLQAGASDIYPKPVSGDYAEYEAVKAKILSKIKLLSGMKVNAKPMK